MDKFIQLPPWFDTKLFGIPASDYVFFGITAAVTLIILPLLIKFLFRFLERVANIKSLQSGLERTEKKVKSWFYLVCSLLVASYQIELPERLRFFVSFICAILILIQLLMISSHWVKHYLMSNPFSKSHNGQISALNQNIATVLIILFWIISFLVLLDNFGFNVATILAGLGVGGIAVGLALQSVFGDFFASFAIGFDKPFELGDFVIIDDFMGTVEKVGLKTSQLRGLGGELLVFPNHDLVNARIRNYQKMRERRILFKIGVTYDTPQEKVEEIPKIIRKIIEDTEQVRFDRSHFASFGDFSLDYETVYYVLSQNYNDYMDVQQQINYKIRKAFIERGIEFAFPTTTIDLPPKEPA